MHFSPSHPKGRRLGALLAAGALALLLAGCAKETKHKWLSTFFDGVPTPGSGTNNPNAVLPFDEDDRPLPKQVVDTNAVASKPPPFTRHPPFEEKKCSECHQSKFEVVLKSSQKKVCFECHDDFLEKAKVKHQPADNNECTACHNPHGSALPKMVKASGKALCAPCHDEAEPKTKVVHTPFANGECINCHSPHSSSNKFLLARTGKANCFQCHDDFLQPAAFRHSAVDDCSACHNSHGTAEKSLLVKSRQQICNECHEPKEMLAVKGHAGIGAAECLQCHDPHTGKNKFLLKPGAIKVVAAPVSGQ